MNQTIVRVFGVPMDLGQNRRGVDMGPSALRYAGLQEQLLRMGFITYDAGNIVVPQAEEPHTDAPYHAHFLPEVTHVCQLTYERIVECWQPGEVGLFVGGDHSISIGTIAAVRQRTDAGVIWVDAHADFNTPQSSPSGNIHGMSVAVLLGDGAPDLVNVGYVGAKLKADDVVMIGVRDVDPPERERLRHSGITVYTMREIDELGISAVMRRILEQFENRSHLHISFDLDSCDPGFAPGVGTPVLGGLSYREAHLLMEILADSHKVRSMDVVEINPILDNRNATAQAAVEMIASLLGKRIL